MEPMIIDGFVHQLPDVDPEETQEWLDSLSAVVDAQGKTRARFLMSKLLERASPPEAHGEPDGDTAHAQPPGPGFPAQAPSVYTIS